MKKHGHLAASLCGGVSALALASLASMPAWAQPADSQQPEQVIVTGSRVIANGNDMPTPVTIVSTEDLTTTTPATVMDGLQALPVFSGGRSPQGNPGNSSQNNAAHQLNLRNIGITRTLVLYDGRRIAPTAPTGEINTDIIPQMLLQRVDVVTGGVSAVYGSDAISGVVNFITNKSFNGVKAYAQSGISEYGDGKEEKFGIAGGIGILGGRGHIEGSYEFYNNAGIAWNDKLQRPWASKVITVQGAGSSANPYHVVFNTRLSSTSFLGYITAPANNKSLNFGNPLADQVFRINGQLSPFQHGALTGGNGVESGGDGAYYYQASLVSLSRSHQLFGRFDYDISDDIQAYVQATGTLFQNENNHQTNEFRNITLGATNAFLSPSQQAAMTGAGKTSFNFSKMITQAPPLQPDTWTTSYLLNAGLNGTLGKYKWDLSYVYNTNMQYTRNNANIDLGKAYAALDAVRDPAGNVVCNVSLTNPGLYPGCQPLDLFGPTSESASALNYVLTVTKYHSITTMHDIGGSIAGSPFDDWAGPVELAVSGEWRTTSFDLSSNAEPTSKLNCTGLRFNCVSGTTLLYISNVVGSVHGISQTVGEGAVEGNIPLLRDLPFAQSVDLNAAFRYTDYDTSGTVETWKVGLDWHINDELTFRATRSLDIRAPNLNDLFAPTLVNPAGVTDLHTGNTVGQAPFITSSNPNLMPEKSNSLTAGVVYRPGWLENFSIAVDYYKVKIGNAITVIQGQSPTIQNICEASNGTSPFCALIVRPGPFSDHNPATNFVTSFLSQPQNAQVVNTEGVDIEANYQTDELGPGHFATRLLASYQPMLKTVQFPGAPVLNSANIAGSPGFRASLFLKYTWEDFSLDILQKFHGRTRWNPDRSLIFADPHLPAAFYTNATVTYSLDPMQFFLAVENVFDKQPTPYGAIGGSSGVPGLFGGFVPGDDAIGRYYTVGARLRM
ncbi:MAG: TonB-dependent receptor [Acidobacteriales bacterium]|nr:TonB-dependent receptor [Terriglobales bacterium]